MSSPLLSIGMIVKNEIRCIEKCLKALAPLREAIPCELVIADTGSSDGTRQVIEQYADLVFEFPWIGDFSAARNAVMDRCSGVWYLSVDADEYLDPDVSQLVKFLQDKGPKPDFGLVLQRNYGSLAMEDDDYGDFKALRLARMSTGVRYKGKIHEIWTTHSTQLVQLLDQTILHHDGYAIDRGKQGEEKARRNMELLRTALEEEPHNLRRLIQCVESSGPYPQERAGYLRDGMEQLLNNEQECKNGFAAPIWRYAIQWAAQNDLPELETWLDWGRNHFSNSSFFKVDVAYFMTAYYYNHQKYQKGVEWGEFYQKGYQDYRSGKCDVKDEIFSSLSCNRPRSRVKGTTALAACMEKLGRGQEALELLLPLEPWRYDEVTLRTMLMVLRDIYQDPRCAGKAAEQCACILDHVLEADMEEEQNKKKRTVCLTFAAQQFGDGNHGLFAQVRGDLGLAARAMDEVEPAILNQMFSQILEWKEIPNPVVLHAIEFEATLPEAFYRKGAESLRNTASALGERPSMPRALLCWVKSNEFDSSMIKFQFVFELTAATLREKYWKKEDIGAQLCELFYVLATDFLSNYYNAELLADEAEWIALPGLHRYALYLTRAYACLEQGDELGYVRALRAGLDAAPAMKGITDFLLEHKPKTVAQRQLEELAEQVQAVLAQYDPDDPAVIALKRSKAFQKVAFMLKEEKAPVARPQKNEIPVSPQPLEEALAGSRETIAASVEHNINRWGDILAKKRVEYWEKYPLWGKNKDEVVEHLSAALNNHKAEFRWLFDRLEDDLSRRILTAVVRSWRFYEIEQLGQVVERVYDDYFDRDILRCDENEVVVDLGAYNGDTFHDYIKNYGSMTYRHYYCYEITKESFTALAKATATYPRVVLRRKGAGDGPGMMTLDSGADASANTLAKGEAAAAEMVEVVAVDDDIAEPLTLIKMDIEGAEQSALKGCAHHIQKDRPKLALSVYHNFEDLWKLPRMIDEMTPGYRFYLRYHGGDLWPSEISLLGIPD